jgi:heme oxygenase (biliverdin-producing, ferredoxin)
MATIHEVDYDVPVSTLLRVETAEAHSAAETSAGAGYLVRGQLDKEEYVRFLMMLWHIYSCVYAELTFILIDIDNALFRCSYSMLEQGLERHATHPVLQPTYNPILFARASALSSDISTLLGVSELEWPSHPINQSLLSSPPTAFSAYTSRLHDLADSSDPSPLLAHSYIRYLGDLSGGQFIARAVSKAYGLDHPDKLGIKFYQFSRLGGGGPANTNADTKKIKDWFRKGMDEGVGDNAPRKGTFDIV